MDIEELEALSESLTTDSNDAVEIWEHCGKWERKELEPYGICEFFPAMWKLFVDAPIANCGESIEDYDTDGIVKELVGYNHHAGYYYVKDVPDYWDVIENHFLGERK
ncbi:hypothetical protein [Varibaculum cambriense]|uniref:hypothetical protein n=1 Tax=Varibaculum cambriense TaxID=184870 RepID=UPI00241EF7D7|nr:hypothetical protein [Varibaculum cambriense]MBS5945037.1 hypothetical protein [Varibaculum cambriense]